MAIWDESFQIAEFGDASCDIDEYSLPLDGPVDLSEQWRATGQVTIDSFNATTSVTVDWASGDSTSASLHFTPDRDGACVRVYTESDGNAQGLEVPGVLEIRSDDGRVDAHWSGTLQPTRVDEGGNVVNTRFQRTTPLPYMPNPTPAELGFPLGSGGDTGVDFFSASYDVAFDDGVVSGSIELRGHQDPATVCELPDDPECNFAIVPLETGMLR
jgi:hypothetical protein